MTREEAIKRFEKQLKGAIAVLDSGFGTHQGESNRLYLERKEMAQFAIDALREQEERRWIPVAERLPDQGDRVLCVVKSFAFPGSKYYNILRCDMYGFNENGIYTDDVTHWMPLPEPPNEV